MTDEDQTSSLADFEGTVAEVMPVALDMIATVVEDPATSWERYAALLEVAEQTPPQLMLALTRIAAGLAVIAEMSPAQVRALGEVDLDDRRTS